MRYIVVGNGPFWVYDRRNGRKIRMYDIRENAVIYAQNLNRMAPHWD